jgi:hypothetical protein
MAKSKNKKAPRYTQADYRRAFGAVCSFAVVESSRHPGEIQINQYSSCLVGPLTPVQARELAANLIAGADACEATKYNPDGSPWQPVEVPKGMTDREPNEKLSAAWDVDAAPVCSACGGELQPLGTLGTVNHFRCRNCGLDSHAS